MKLVYFAWIRERIGKPAEEIDLPEHVGTIADLIAYLKTLGENYAYALEQSDVIRVAADQSHVTPDHPLRDVREVALFPPMTGG